MAPTVYPFTEIVPGVSGVSTPAGHAGGTDAGGSTVTLTGSGFTGASAVNFGSTPVEPEVKSANEIVAAAPEGSGTVPVTVSTADGSTHETPGTQFTYSP